MFNCWDYILKPLSHLLDGAEIRDESWVQTEILNSHSATGSSVPLGSLPLIPALYSRNIKIIVLRHLF